MRKPANRVLALSVATAAFITPAAFAKRVHVPKHTPVAPHITTADTVFSSPDADGDVVPGFVGKKGQPINMEMDRVFAFDPNKLLGDLTKEQKQQIQDVNKHTNESVTAIQDNINTLNQQLDVLKAHPLPKMGPYETQTPDQIRNQITDLRKSIVQKRKENTDQIQAVLTDQQRDQIQRMRHGEIMHEISEMDRKETNK